MTYMEAVEKAIEATVSFDSSTGFAYVEPLYRMTLRSEGLVYNKSFPMTAELPSEGEMAEILKLFVEKVNAKQNKVNAVMNWLYDVITQTADPAMNEENNELFKDMLEYMKMKEKIRNEKTQEAESKDSAIKDAKKIIPFDLNFSKRENN